MTFRLCLHRLRQEGQLQESGVEADQADATVSVLRSRQPSETQPPQRHQVGGVRRMSGQLNPGHGARSRGRTFRLRKFILTALGFRGN